MKYTREKSKEIKSKEVGNADQEKIRGNGRKWQGKKKKRKGEWRKDEAIERKYKEK